MDFICSIYKRLLIVLQAKGYAFQNLNDFLQQSAPKAVVLRHDIDKLPGNALKMAQLEHELGIAVVYYFRAVPESWDEAIMEQIVAMGHELGYHYEDLAIAGGDHKKAIRHFEDQLARFRRIYPVKTICMHGSPFSKWDNRDLWEKYDYRDYGIIAEPYFDIDYDEVFYITDTGRAWNNSKVSVRDKVASRFDIDIKSGLHLIELILKNKLPDKIMLNVHPHRWFDYGYNWYKELLMQNVKNQIKSLIVRIKGK